MAFRILLLFLLSGRHFGVVTQDASGWEDPPFSIPDNVVPEVEFMGMVDGTTLLVKLNEEIGNVTIAKVNYNGEPKIGDFMFGMSNEALGAYLHKDDGGKWTLDILKKQDYEVLKQPKQYRFDINGGTTKRSVILPIININDNAPSIVIDDKSCMIPENCIEDACFQNVLNQDCFQNMLKKGTGPCTMTVSDLDGDIDLVKYEVLDKGVVSNEFAMELAGDQPEAGDKEYNYKRNLYLKVIKELDFEKKALYTLNLTATDKDSQTDGSMLMVQVDDLPDEGPKFTDFQNVVKIEEESENTVQFHAIDGDLTINDTILFKLDVSNLILEHQAFFEINESSGLLSISRIDRDVLENDVFEFKVIAFEKCPPNNETVLPFTVMVEDINDNSPTFNKIKFSIKIDEMESNMQLTELITIEDADLANNGRFYIALKETKQSKAFLVIPGMGYQSTNITISILDPNKLDYEDEDWRTILLEVVATELEDGNHNATAEIHIELVDINDETPQFSQTGYTGKIPECANAGLYVATVLATDADAADITLNHTLAPTSQTEFAIDTTTGIVTVVGNCVFDYEQQQTVFLTVWAEDVANHRNYSQLTIEIQDINDESPILTVLSSQINLEEDSNVYKEVAYAKDPDTMATLVFRIEWDETTAFKGAKDVPKIDFVGCLDIIAVPEENGKIMRGVLVNGGLSLDYELYDTLYLRVVVNDTNTDDNYPNKTDARATLTILIGDINDNEPEFEEPSYEASVKEHSDTGYLIATVRALDLDGPLNSKITYSLRNVDAPARWVKIKPDSGEILVDEHRAIDCEERRFLVYEITASDGTFQDTASINISVIDTNDHKPAFNDNNTINVFLNEHSDNGKHVLYVWAYDDDYSAPFNTITYKLDRSTAENIRELFAINNETGELIVDYSGNDQSALDYENTEMRTLNLHISIHDNYYADDESDSKSATQIFTVLLKDINDNPPIFDRHDDCYEVHENVAKDTVVTIKLSAKDKDSNENGDVSYSILNIMKVVSGELVEVDEVLFAVKDNEDNNDGTVYTKFDLTNRWGTYNVTFLAKDHGTEPQSSNHTYSICVLDVNNNAPVFTYPGDKPIKLIMEQSVNQELLGFDLKNLPYIHADDDDDDQNAKVEFEITGDVYAREHLTLTSLEDNRGRLTLSNEFDPNHLLFDLTIKAQDRGDEPKNVNKTVRVMVRAVRNSEPTFEITEIELSFSENTTGLSETRLISEATDVDNLNCVDFEEECDEIYYYIVDGENADGAEHFLLDHVTRFLSVRPQNMLDYEKMEKHTLVVMATNNESLTTGGPEKSKLKITINVKNIIDTAPVFNATDLSGGIASTERNGKIVFVAQVFDPEIWDTDPNDEVTFEMVQDSFVASNPSLDSFTIETFAMEPTSGELILSVDLSDASLRGYFEFQVKAYDIGNNSNQVPAKVYIVSNANTYFLRFNNDQNFVREKRDYIIFVLSDKTALKCNVDGIAIVTDKDGVGDKTKTIVDVHFIDRKTNLPVEAASINSMFSDTAFTRELHNALQVQGLELYDYNYNEKEEVPEDLLPTIMIGVAALLGVLLGVVSIIYFIHSRRLNNRLNAMTDTKFGSQSSGLNRIGLAAPNTNQHAVEGSNPVWETTIKAGDFDTDSVSSGDSDLIGVEDNPEFTPYSRKNGADNLAFNSTLPGEAMKLNPLYSTQEAHNTHRIHPDISEL